MIPNSVIYYWRHNKPVTGVMPVTHYRKRKLPTCPSCGENSVEEDEIGCFCEVCDWGMDYDEE